MSQAHAEVSGVLQGTVFSARRVAVAVALLYLVHLAMVGWWVWEHAPNGNEWAHLASGVYFLTVGRHELYLVNPPLTRYVAGLGGLVGGLRFESYRPGEAQWDDGGDAAPARPEFRAGERLRDRYGAKAWLAIRYARLLLAVLASTGIVAMYVWGKSLAGPAVGLAAAFLWAASPTMLAWDGALNPDAAAAAAMAWLGAALAHDHRHRSAKSAAVVGGAMGMGWATKFTLLAATPFALLSVLLARLRGRHWKAALIHPLTGGLLAYAVLLAAYGSLPSLRPLGSYRYHSGLFRTAANGILSEVPALVPDEMIRGLDIQQYDLEHPRPTYVAGRHYRERVWWYYFYCWLVKEPPAAVLLVLMGMGFLLWRTIRRDDAAWRALLTLMPGLAIWAVLSVHGEFTTFYRYAFPGLPALWIAGAIALVRLRQLAAIGEFLIWLFVGLLVASAATTAPHWTSYFSEAVGGPRAGPGHLGGMNLDWGQDLPALARWAMEHPEARPLYVATPSTDPLSLYGLTHATSVRQLPVGGEASGWYAIGVGTVVETPERYAAVIRNKPVARVAYTFLIYRYDER